MVYSIKNNLEVLASVVHEYKTYLIWGEQNVVTDHSPTKNNINFSDFLQFSNYAIISIPKEIKSR